MIIKKAELTEIPAIQAIARRTIDLNYRKFLGDEGVDWFISGPSDEYLALEYANMWVMHVDYEVKGFAIIKDDLIDLMMINHDDHRKGLGSTLLNRMEEELFKSYDQIRLESFEGNFKTNNFYVKNGWINVATVPDELSGGNKYCFVKKINQVANYR